MDVKLVLYVFLIVSLQWSAAYPDTNEKAVTKAPVPIRKLILADYGDDDLDNRFGIAYGECPKGYVRRGTMCFPT